MESCESKGGSKINKYRPNRLEYLDQLVIEFQTTESKDAKEQILANLSNFAYDPVNYDYFRQLNALDLFLDILSEKDENLIKFSIAGLCNLCLDPLNKEYINKNGLTKIIKLLEHNNFDIAISTITTLMFLMTPESKAEITSIYVIKAILRLSKEKNSRLENLTAIFLKDYCTEAQIREASISKNKGVLNKIELKKNLLLEHKNESIMFSVLPGLMVHVEPNSKPGVISNSKKSMLKVFLEIGTTLENLAAFPEECCPKETPQRSSIGSIFHVSLPES